MKTITQYPRESRQSSLLLIKFVLAIMATCCTIVVAISQTVVDGLGVLFLLPFSFMVACVFSKNAILYAKDSFGLLFLYALIVLRYLVSPVLIVLSGRLVPGISTSATGLRFAIFMMILELFTIVISINCIWKPVCPSDPAEIGHDEMKLTWVGTLVCLVLIAAIFYRGTLPNVLDHLSFGQNFSFSRVELKTYDMSVVLTLKAFFFLLIVSWLSKKYHRSNHKINKAIYIILVILTAAGNALVYDATNRATMVMCAMASLTVLLYCFGKIVKKLIPIITIFGILFIWSLFAYSTLGVREGERFIDKPDYISSISNMAELYSNGVSTEAHSFDMYGEVTSRMTIITYISELIKSNNLFSLPGLWVIGGWVRYIPSIQELFSLTLYDKAYILPNAGLAMYSASEYFGWLADIVFHVLIVVGIFYFYKKKQTNHNISYKYIYSYCEMIFGFGLMNNIMIVVGLLSAIPFILFVLLKLNALGKKSR